MKEATKPIEFMLSTSDNPFNPHTQFKEWFAFDEGKGYHTSEYLARVMEDVTDADDFERILATNIAIEEILRYNLTGNYIKVAPPN